MAKMVNYKVCLKFLVAMFFLLNTASAQNQQNFNKIFEKETAEIVKAKNENKFKNVEFLSYYPDTLPQWFFQLPVAGSVVYAMGISDPDMELDEAKSIAILRAKSNALLFANAKIQYFRDIYTSAQEEGRYTNLRQRFDTYFKISTSSPVNEEMFSVVDTHFTRYNEYLVLLQLNPNAINAADTASLTTVGTTLLIEANIDDAFEDQAEYEMMNIFKSVQQLNQKAHYLYREKGSRFLSYSAFNNRDSNYPVYVYTYASPFWTTARHPYTTYNGLWSIYTRQLLNYLTLNSQQNSIKLKNIGEQYTTELSSLSREIASFTAKININGINFDTDTFKLDIQVEELTKIIK